jgi:hypothetical protein
MLTVDVLRSKRELVLAIKQNDVGENGARVQSEQL